jgi:Flp pilus assembly protein TadG
MIILRRLARDTGGSVFVEFTLIFAVFLTVIMGIVEFGLVFWQWNSASKAVQLGGRLAAVSTPLDPALATIQCAGGAADTGKKPHDYFIRTCSGATGQCTGTGNATAVDTAAMNTLVFGRGSNSCQDAVLDQLPGMCNIFSRITPQNVVVTYEETGLGFCGRPGGPVPTITVQLTGLTFDWIFMDVLVPGIGDVVQLPGLRTTITGEDLKSTN